MSITLKAGEIEPRKLYSFVTSAVIPRPVALVATISKEGVRNLSPFSYFNAVSTQPPLLMIAPVVKMKDGGQKDTYLNLKEVPELTINMVTYDMAEQMSLASSPYGREVDEFAKSGFSPLKSDIVKVERVKESPVSFECKVFQIIELGTTGGAGNLILCEILAVHMDENLLDDKGLVDPFKADFVARLGGNYYSRLVPESIFSIQKPEREIGVGVDAIPAPIKAAGILSGTELARLGGITSIPEDEEWERFPELLQELTSFTPVDKTWYLHRAGLLLRQQRVTEAWLVVQQYIR